MTILQSLTCHYDRLAASGKAPSYGYSEENISYALVLSPKGKVQDVLSLLDTDGKKPRPSRRQVPQPVKRTSGVSSNFLWDKSAYTLGLKKDRDTGAPVPAEREHEAFRTLHAKLLDGTKDEGLQALLSFLKRWTTDEFKDLPHAEDVLDANVVFRLDGDRNWLLHDRPEARRVWERHLAGQESDEGTCLVTGKTGPIARLHPSIKGVNGAQSVGASIVSFNKDAFISYDKIQGENAPVSQRAAFAYTTALNWLLSWGNRRKVVIGDTSTVFWACAGKDPQNVKEAEAAEDLFSLLVDGPTEEEEEAVVAEALKSIASGRLPRNLPREMPFYVLGLAPNASRLSVRFWHTDSFGAFSERLGEHHQDLRLEPCPWKSFPTVRQLLRETAAQGKHENIPPIHGGALMRSILTGGPYPRFLLSAVITRMRADRVINGRRASICKACIARSHRLGAEPTGVPVELDTSETNPAYLLGRLFATYANAQWRALGKDMITERHYCSASATPAATFPLLERNSAHHLSLLRKEGKSGWLERETDSILSGVGTTFPRHLDLEDQGRFAVGYYHQRATKRTPAGATEEDSEVSGETEGEE